MALNEPGLVLKYATVSYKPAIIRALVAASPVCATFTQQREGKELTKEEKQRLRKEKKQQKKCKEKKEDKAAGDDGNNKKPVISPPSAQQPPAQPRTEKGAYCGQHHWADSFKCATFCTYIFFLLGVMISAFTDSCLLQLLQQCLLQFLCLPLNLLPRLISQRRVKQRRRQREELGKRQRGPPNRARRERWGSRLPQANLNLSPASCSQVLEHPGGQHHLKSYVMFLWRKSYVSCVVSGEEAPRTYPG